MARGGCILGRIDSGICYGHQLLADALGGTVDYNLLGPERGTTEVTLLKAASTDPLFGGLPQTIEVHVSHSQLVLRLPSDALLPLLRTTGIPTRRSASGIGPGAFSFIPSSMP